MPTPISLTDGQLREFAARGYLLVPRVVPPALIARASARAYPDIELPEPAQVTGRAGDLLLAHYLLGHNIGGNFASEAVRRMLYFRIMREGHENRREAFLQDAWLEFDPIRAFVAGERENPSRSAPARS